MLEWLLAPIFRFISSFDEPEKTQEDEKLDAVLRSYVGKELWLALAPDRSKVLFTAFTLERLQEKANALGLDARDFISCRAPKKIAGDSE